MATVTTGLRLYDQMSGVLGGIVKSLNLTVSAMSDVQASMGKSFNPAAVNAARTAIQQTEAALKALPGPVEEAQQKQDKFTQAVERSEKSAGGLVDTVKRLAAAYLTVEGMKNIGQATIGGAMEQQKMLDMFIARTGNVQLGTAMFERFKADALAAGQDVSKSLQSTLSFFSATQNTDQLTKLNNLAQRLAAFDSAGNGIEGAAFALKEAMSGDIVSLAERFNMSKSDIRKFGIDELGKTGNIDGFLKAFDQLLEKQRMGQEAYERMLASPAKQAEIMVNNMKSQFANAGQSAMEALLPLIVTLNQAFKEGRFQPFFDGLSASLKDAAQILAWLVDGALWLSDVIANNWSWIEPMIWGIVSAMTGWWLVSKGQAIMQGLMAAKSSLATAALFVEMVATFGLAAAWRTLNAAMKANIIVFIISAVIALGVWLFHLWKVNDQFAVGVYRAWNGLLNFFGQVPIFVARVTFGVIDILETMKVRSLQIVDQLINGVISGINWLIDKLNKIPGVSIEAIGQVEYASKAATEAEAVRQANAAALAAMESSAAQKAAEREQRVLDFAASRAALRAQEEAAKQPVYGPPLITSTGQPAIDNIGNIDKVGEVGRIRDSVDISSEDLKIMREVAERQSIQNFVTLQPQLSFGDTHIRQDGRTVDEIIANIRDKFAQELASSARGVLS